jgi:hypothetical protein
MNTNNQGPALPSACDCGCSRRDFLTTVSLAMGSMAFVSADSAAGTIPPPAAGPKQAATVRVVFLYPPSQAFAEQPDGWWSWPGNDFDAEGRQKQFTTALREMEQTLGMKLDVEEKPIGDDADAQRLAEQIQTEKPDGLLLVMFYNNSLKHADLLLKAADTAEIPIVFYIGLGVKHGSIRQYRRPGVYLIQSLDNFDAIEYGLRMINTKRRMSQSRLLSITEAPEPREGIESFFGTTVRVIPFARYAEEFQKVTLDDAARRLITQFTAGAQEQRGITPEALENAARAHLALTKMLADEQADGLTMNCLRRGMLKPCMSFATLNNQLIPATCENDFPAMYTQLLGSVLNRLFGPDEKGVLREQQIRGDKMPDYEKVRVYLGPAGLFVQSEDNGWYVAGCLLKKPADGMEPAGPMVSRRGDERR